jgi:putative peptidoglycan lipid II flippase
MMKLSRLSKVTLLLASFFFLDKILAFARQVLIARQFGLSSELDTFNVANNIPDFLFAAISGGALAIAFIPVLAEVLLKKGQRPSWDLFSRVANLSFLITAFLSILVAILANPLVKTEIGIAPGFTSAQQTIVIQLMRLNLIATLIFSISGLVMAGLQANQHFLLPAMAPLFYNVGQIFGVLVLAPSENYSIGPITLPAFGLGVKGLVYGVIIGAIFHLMIQLPGLIKYKFHWIPSFEFKHPDVIKVLRLMGPRFFTILLIQLIFFIRDNLASRLSPGSVTSLTYGWMIQQVPETLIGTAIGTALLPTLAEHFSADRIEEYKITIRKAMQFLIALTLPVAVILTLGIPPLLSIAFNFSEGGTRLLSWVTAAFLLGLTGHSLKEVGARSFYARQKPFPPLITAAVNIILYLSLGIILYRPLGAAGIALTDSIVFTIEALLLFFLLKRQVHMQYNLTSTVFRSVAAAICGGVITWGGIALFTNILPSWVASIASMFISLIVALIWMIPELKNLRNF